MKGLIFGLAAGMAAGALLAANFPAVKKFAEKAGGAMKESRAADPAEA